MVRRPVAVMLQILLVVVLAAAMGHAVTAPAPPSAGITAVAGGTLPQGTSFAGVSYAQHQHRLLWLKVQGRWRLVPA